MEGLFVDWSFESRAGRGVQVLQFQPGGDPAPRADAWSCPCMHLALQQLLYLVRGSRLPSGPLDSAGKSPLEERAPWSQPLWTPSLSLHGGLTVRRCACPANNTASPVKCRPCAPRNPGLYEHHLPESPQQLCLATLSWVRPWLRQFLVLQLEADSLTSLCLCFCIFP